MKSPVSQEGSQKLNFNKLCGAVTVSGPAKTILYMGGGGGGICGYTFNQKQLHYNLEVLLIGSKNNTSAS